MTAYAAPLADMRFVINELAGLSDIATLPGFEEATPDLVDAVLEEAGRFGAEVLAPLNQVGDREGSVFENGIVRTAPGFKDAYHQFIEGGWNGLPAEAEFGGQGLPWLVSTAVSEVWNAANMSFALCPLLNQGAFEMLSTYASPEQKATYLTKIVAGTWTGTMNLTEPQAGSDLARVRTKAVKDGSHYRVSGQKIFITYGEHDFTENIVHLVLARTPDAPKGVKGISLFIVPKFMVNEDGTLGSRNDLRCVSLEHKLGIHASPTAVMSYGDDEGAVGYLVGEENRGLEYMFAMMNHARVGVGLEGVAIAERAYQQARDYARERLQGRHPDGPDNGPVAIINHPDVRRMVLSMKAQTEAARALTYCVAAALDRARHHPDEAARRENQAFVNLLTPVVKAWCSDTGIEVANTGIQVHGGMGYIEETGAAQHLRDARINAIYEGTNGIQANDLVGRKIGREGGESVKALIAAMRKSVHELANGAGDDTKVIRTRLSAGVDALDRATGWLLETFPGNPGAVSAGAVPYLRLLGIVSSGWLMARAAAIASAKLAGDDGDAGFMRGKILTVRFFADHVLSQADSLTTTFTEGAASILELEEEQF